MLLDSMTEWNTAKQKMDEEELKVQNERELGDGTMDKH